MPLFTEEEASAQRGITPTARQRTAERGPGPSLSHWEQRRPNRTFCSDRDVLNSGPSDLVPTSHVWLWGPLGHGQYHWRVKFYIFVSPEFKREQQGRRAIG